MHTKTGLWIDQSKAVIVTVSAKGIETKTVKSNIDNFKTQYGRKDRFAYDIEKRDCEQHLQNFFDIVIAGIRNAEEIFLFGPSGSKDSLKKRMVKNKINGRIVRMETVGKMTDHMIKTKVRKYFVKDPAAAAR